MVKLTLFLSLNFIKTKIKPICNEPNISYDMNLTWSRYVDGKFGFTFSYLPPIAACWRRAFVALIWEKCIDISVWSTISIIRDRNCLYSDFDIFWSILHSLSIMVWKWMKIKNCLLLYNHRSRIEDRRPYFYEWKGWLISCSM